MKILITGGLGFIGSHLIKNILDTTTFQVLNIDKISRVSLPISLKKYSVLRKYKFIKLV